MSAPRQVFESGAIYDPKVLDIKDENLLSQVSAAVSRVAAVSLELNYPTLASIPHSVINGYKNVLAVAVETDYSFDLADKVTSRLSTCVCSAHAMHFAFDASRKRGSHPRECLEQADFLWEENFVFET